jgi:hypothetical protein
MNSLRIVTALGFLAVMSSACGSQVGSRPQAEAFEVELRTRNDDGAPLAGAAWTASRQPLGETGADGTLRLTLRGREGQSMQTALTCPDGYTEPDSRPEVRLTHTRRISDKRVQPVTVEAVCTRTAREIALVVHTERGPALPVLVDGKAAGSTDDDGNAHVLLRVDRSVRKLDVAVDTSARAELTPKNPTRSFELDGRDGVLVFAESFSRSVAPKVRSPGRSKYVPYRVN